jgi:hypothetical protein
MALIILAAQIMNTGTFYICAGVKNLILIGTSIFVV